MRNASADETRALLTVHQQVAAPRSSESPTIALSLTSRALSG